MRNQPLTGYILHARPYQEKRAIYQLFSREWGMVHGVGVRGVPTFVLVSLFASGNSSLKTFRQITPTSHYFSPVGGQVQYALLYVNEVLCRLLVPENPCPVLYEQHQQTISGLSALGVVGTHNQSQGRVLRLLLRAFERSLFDELGVAVDFGHDNLGRAIDPDGGYVFVPEGGFVPYQQHKPQSVVYQGKELLYLAQANKNPAIYDEKLTIFSQLQRQLMDYLLDGTPLNSRKLWQQSQHYHSL